MTSIVKHPSSDPGRGEAGVDVDSSVSIDVCSDVGTVTPTKAR